MKKVKLELDELTVESFATADVEEEQGTVHGHSGSCAPDPYSRCGPNKCDPFEDPSQIYGSCIDGC